MQFEQEAELNRYLDATIPLTWRVRWTAFKPVLPMLFFCSILLVEQVAFRLWLNNKNLISELPILILCALCPMALLPLLFEVQIRLAHRSKRRLTFKPKSISLSPAKTSRIPWKWIQGWRLEPVIDVPDLRRLTVEYALDKKGKLRRQWSMIVRQADQEQALVSELEYFRQLGLNSGPLIRSAQAIEMKKENRRLRSMVAVALGFYLLLHGIPLLSVGVFFPDAGNRDESRATSSFTPKERAKFKRFVGQHISSRQQLRTVMLVTGAGLTGLGAVLYLWGLGKFKGRQAN